MRNLGRPILLALVGLALAGCGGAKPARTTASPQYPIAPRPVRLVALPRTQMRDVRFTGHGAGFVSPTRLGVMTTGSSNCRTVPSTIAVTSPHSIRLGFKDEAPANGICLTNLIIEPVVIAISPTQIDVHHTLTIHADYPRTRRPTVFTAAPLS